MGDMVIGGQSTQARLQRSDRGIDAAAKGVTVDEARLIDGLRAGDERAFAVLVDLHAPAMLRVARGYVPSREIAEEVVQEAWIAVLKGIAGFEGRSSLRTWLFAVMINIAKSRGIRERRDADAAIAAFTGGTVDPARFRSSDDPWPGHWRQDAVPEAFPDTPEGSLLEGELVEVAKRGLDGLPDRQRVVVALRDMLGFDAAEVCDLLDISGANQRVLLHRGRAAVRAVLEDYLGEVS
jgi:RNA polymerase sigma-70 factor (ECF subfamily)